MSFKKQTFFKSSEVRGFLFFLLLTSMVAILIKLSKDYTKTYRALITIDKVPIDKVIKSVTPKEIEFRTKLSGFSLLRNSFNDPEIKINFGSLDSITQSKLNYDTNKISALLEEVIPGGKEFYNYKSPSITIEIDIFSTKKLPIFADVDIDFNNGYNTYTSPIIKPDSVTVVGPLGVLEKLNKVQTQSKKINNITGEVLLTLDLDTLAIYKELKFSEDRFTYKQKVAKYTEGFFSIPITVRATNKERMKIFPREVVLFFIASLKEYDSVLATDFEVVADFSTKSDREEYVTLSISRKPDNVRNVRLETKQIKFIIVN